MKLRNLIYGLIFSLSMVGGVLAETAYFAHYCVYLSRSNSSFSYSGKTVTFNTSITCDPGSGFDGCAVCLRIFVYKGSMVYDSGRHLVVASGGSCIGGAVSYSFTVPSSVTGDWGVTAETSYCNWDGTCTDNLIVTNGTDHVF